MPAQAQGAPTTPSTNPLEIACGALLHILPGLGEPLAARAPVIHGAASHPGTLGRLGDQMRPLERLSECGPPVVLLGVPGVPAAMNATIPAFQAPRRANAPGIATGSSPPPPPDALRRRAGQASARRTWKAHLPDARSARPTGALHRLELLWRRNWRRSAALARPVHGNQERGVWRTPRAGGTDVGRRPPMRRRPQACVRCLPPVIAAVLTAIAAVVTAIRSPVMTVLNDGRGTNDGRGSRDRSTTEYSHPASTSRA